MKYVLIGSIDAKWALKQTERADAANAQCKALGIKIESMHYVQGPYDFVVVADAPDAETMLGFSLWYANKGYGKLMSLPAHDGATMVRACKRAGG